MASGLRGGFRGLHFAFFAAGSDPVSVLASASGVMLTLLRENVLGAARFLFHSARAFSYLLFHCCASIRSNFAMLTCPALLLIKNSTSLEVALSSAICSLMSSSISASEPLSPIEMPRISLMARPASLLSLCISASLTRSSPSLAISKAGLSVLKGVWVSGRDQRRCS